jgi:hypothetical protein
MAKIRYGGLALAGCLVLLALSACDRQGRNDMSWARAALERNDTLEVVAADQQSRTFTVRMKDTGELRVVHVDEIVASPALLAVATPQTPAPSAPPAEVNNTPPADNTAQRAPAEAGENAAVPLTQPATFAPQSAGAVEAASGRVLESGPGYTIKSAEPASAGATRLRSAGITNSALERRHEPIVCQGARLLHIDNRNLAFDGDAVSAQDGCEIHITNSHISATGVGVLVRAANVHIDNSMIEGDQASIDASEGAQVYAASSQFRGLSRRLDSASFHDLGGNIWN